MFAASFSFKMTRWCWCKRVFISSKAVFGTNNGSKAQDFTISGNFLKERIADFYADTVFIAIYDIKCLINFYFTSEGNKDPAIIYIDKNMMPFLQNTAREKRFYLSWFSYFRVRINVT